MFISKTRFWSGYNRDSEQVARGFFMYWLSIYKDSWLFNEKPADYVDMASTEPFYTQIYATVRYVPLHQLGHWMMGHARVGGIKLSASGSLGGDGLPHTTAEIDLIKQLGSFTNLRTWLDKHFEVVPEPVHLAWAKSDGHNTCNSTVVRDYGADLFKRMYEKKRAGSCFGAARYCIKDKPWDLPLPAPTPASTVSSVT